jgi:hypothetical protein
VINAGVSGGEVITKNAGATVAAGCAGAIPTSNK